MLIMMSIDFQVGKKHDNNNALQLDVDPAYAGLKVEDLSQILDKKFNEHKDWYEK